jgi:hypothetical protein
MFPHGFNQAFDACRLGEFGFGLGGFDQGEQQIKHCASHGERPEGTGGSRVIDVEELLKGQPQTVCAFEEMVLEGAERLLQDNGLLGGEMQERARRGLQPEEEPVHDEALGVGAEPMPLIWLRDKDVSG